MKAPQEGESMETQAPIENFSVILNSENDPKVHPSEFVAGSTVIYALHGKCTILGIEDRQMENGPIRFYKLEVQKSNLSRSNRQEPAIWVPVANAQERGLRLPIDSSQAEAVFGILSNREYYFETTLSWSVIQPKLETATRLEGSIGLAKVESYLHVLKRKQIVPTPEVTRMSELVHRLLIRELTEATGEAPRVLEDRIARALKQKLIADN